MTVRGPVHQSQFVYRKNTLNIVNVRHGQQVVFSSEDEQRNFLQPPNKNYHEIFNRNNSLHHSAVLSHNNNSANVLPELNVSNSFQILPNNLQKSLSPSRENIKSYRNSEQQFRQQQNSLVPNNLTQLVESVNNAQSKGLNETAQIRKPGRNAAKNISQTIQKRRADYMVQKEEQSSPSKISSGVTQLKSNGN